MNILDTWMHPQKLICGVDIGTVQSAVSFALLERNKMPEIKHVTGWPGETPQRAKTPTSMYYDANGTPRSFGADTQSDAVKEQAAAEGWTLVHSFKRYVHRLGVSAELSDQADLQPPPPLPSGVDEKKLYSDWLTFLFKHTKEIICSNFPSKRWGELSSNIEVVFTVPNAWYTQEHAILSDAAVASRFIGKPSAVRFVPETEAAVHWALHQGDLHPKAGTDFIVCDSGGSTTDIAMYNVVSTSPLQLREKEGNPSKCIEAGSALINDSFNVMFRNEFADGDEEEAEIFEAQEQVAEPFEREKAEFDGSKDTYEFYYDEEIPSASGGKYIEVTREKMEELFDSVINLILPSIDEFRQNNDPQFLLLLGDFGHSPYFQKKLRVRYKKMKLIPADQQNIKAAAAGALVWTLKHSVVARAARFSFGQEVDIVYDPKNAEHVRRGAVSRPSGHRVAHGWSAVIPRGALLKDGEEHKKSFKRVYSKPDERLGKFASTIYLAEESVESSLWMRDRHGTLVNGFREVCTVTADLSSQQGKLRKEFGPHGPYWSLAFEIAIAFGSTALEARISWSEGGRTRTGPATIIPAQFE